MRLDAEIPPLREPVLIAAFAGWNDAAEAATCAAEHVREQLAASMLGAIDPEDYYDFQVARPMVTFTDGARRVTWPSTSIFVAPGAAHETAADGPRDVLIVIGIEPSYRWRTFVMEIVDLARQVGASLVVTLGAMLADVPHSRPIPVVGSSEDPELIRRFGLEFPTYEGPTGIVGVLGDAARSVDLPVVSLWASVPHYAAGSRSPKATLALLKRLETLIDRRIGYADLPELSQAWERGVDELAQGDEEVARYVAALEQAQDAADHPDASGDAIAAEFERYLRRRDDDEPVS